MNAKAGAVLLWPRGGTLWPQQRPQRVQGARGVRYGLTSEKSGGKESTPTYAHAALLEPNPTGGFWGFLGGKLKNKYTKHTFFDFFRGRSEASLRPKLMRIGLFDSGE